MSKNIASINITSREQFGESQYLSKYSNQLVELMQPVALQANKDLYSEEYQAIANQAQAMLKSGELNSVQEAQAYVNDAFQMYLNPYQAMSSGNTMQKWTAINTYAQGGIDSPSAWLKNLVGNTRTAYSWAGGDTLTGSIIQNAYGGRNYRYINTNNSNKTEDILDDIVIKNNEDLAEEFAKQVGLADNYNTNTDKIDKAVINATADIGDIKSIITDKGWAIGEVIVGGITAWLGAKLIGGVIGKGIGALSGLGGATGAAGGILAVGGGIALGATAGLLITKAINDGVREAAKKENESDKSKSSMEARGLAEDLGLSEGVTSLNIAGSNIYNSDKNWLGSKFDNYENAELFGADLGWWDLLDEKDFTQTLDKATKEADTYKYNKAKIGKALNYGGLGFGSATLSALAKAWVIGLYSQGYTGKNANIYKALADTLNIGAFTPDEGSIADLLMSDGFTRSQFNNIVEAMKKADMWLWNDNGKWIMPNESDYDKALKISEIDDETREWLNSHRQGLDEVPYDNYPALLHEGEAVLTASTSNELRNLLDEYRNNNKMNANLEVAIQQQTQDLCYKLDEVISTISSLSIGNQYMTKATNDQIKARNKLNNSMTHISSTKEGLN